jgi:hypothetical protein
VRQQLARAAIVYPALLAEFGLHKLKPNILVTWAVYLFPASCAPDII